MPRKRDNRPQAGGATAATPPPPSAKKTRRYDLSKDASEGDTPEETYRAGVSRVMPGELLKSEEDVELGEEVYSVAKRRGHKWALHVCRPVAEGEPLTVEVSEVGTFPATEIVRRLEEVASREDSEYLNDVLGDDLRSSVDDELRAKGEYLDSHTLGWYVFESESDWYLVKDSDKAWTLWVTGENDGHPLNFSADALDTYATREEALAAYREQTGEGNSGQIDITPDAV
jgi:hypothetical protein